MSSSAMSTEDVLDEIERLDQSITRTLLEIDQSFSNCQIIVSSKILPQIDRYAESSAEVWKNARVWLNFFEAANAPTPPAPGRRTQAVRNAVSKQRAAGAFSSSVSANGPSAGADSTTPEYSFRRQSRQDDIADNSTNRPRIDSINLSSARLSPNFMANSPGESMPSTPTPLHGSRNARSRQQEDIAPPAPIRWSQENEGERNNDSRALNQSVGTTTPIRSRYQYNSDALERASTTPTITLRDRPMSLSHYTQAASSAKSPAKTSQSRYRSQQTSERERSSVDGGFLQLDVEENHQDVITPPSTLHFSIPESKLAGTPRSVVAKSLVDKIRMKDGLVIPQPIFVNDDEDEDAATLEQYTGLRETAAAGTSTAEETGGIGGSKKRSRDGDLLDVDIDSERDGGRSRSWASLTDQQRNRERLLKSPRKMASVQDFFDASPPAPPAPPNLNALAPSQAATQEEGDEEDGSQSPSRQLMSQIQSQAESFEDDPLLAALATPPEVRKTIREHKARFSVVQRPVSAPTALSSSVARSTSTVSTSASTPPTTAAKEQSAAERIRDAALASMVENAARRTSSAGSGSTSHHVALLTTAPVGTTAVDTPALRTARSNIDTIFKESFTSGFASSSSNRRQTMATPVDLTRTPQNNSLLNSNRGAGANNRNSVGSSARNSIGAGFSSLLTPRPFGGATRAGAPGATPSSRLSLLGTSAFRKPLHPTSPSPASRAAANAIASATAAAQDVLSQKAGTSTSDHQQSVEQTSQSSRSNGLTRLTQPVGMGRFSIGGGYGSSAGGRASATPIVSTANFLAQAQDAQQTTTHRSSVGKSSQEGPGSDISSRGSHTPFSMREPPPAPRLGYHSDTMMTQSSLGLNHDGFGGYDSEDRTRMTMASGGESGNAAISSHERSLAANAAASTSNATTNASRRMEDEGGYGGDGSVDDDDDDDDVTENIMKSPCPPGRTGSIPFLGSRTDLKSVAQAATARPTGGRASILGGSVASTSAGSSGGPGGLSSLFKR
ncbi:DASH complex subunit ask1 [Mortierella alpina]|nr:DASH complex subunit ask1 [Mortierella alpina]